MAAKGGVSKLDPAILVCIQRALEEDVGSGDATTNGIVAENAILNGKVIAKQDGIVAGLEVAAEVLRSLDENISFLSSTPEGARVVASTVLAQVSGSARALLTGERTALNFLGRMSGIATLTREFADTVQGTRAIILDTRKTAPGLRAVDKLAVRRGGGENHRQGLFDMVLIKDNHIDFAGSLRKAVESVRASGTALAIEVEARTIEDVEEALRLGITRILLDNMPIELLRRAVELNAGRAKLEASGNVALENVRQIAETGVDYISVGALTHSPKVFDVSLQWVAG